MPKTPTVTLGHAEITDVAVSDLHFDADNPRLVDRGGTDAELLQAMWTEFAAKEVALSIAANGFWSYEPLIVATEDGKKVVVEGNRRLAAVKLLLSADERRRVGATDLPEISPDALAKLERLPVIHSSREDTWQFIGFKHVNGPQQWQSYSKAQYIGWVHNHLGVPLANIAETIGDTHQTALRLYRALMTLEQAEREGVWTRDDRYKSHFSFSHLYVGLNSYSGIQSYIGLDGPPADTTDPVPRGNLDELRELLVWMFGSKRDEVPPVVVSQNPHLRQLDQVLANKNAVSAIRQGMPLTVAVDVAKGDAAKLREDLVAARRLLQDSRGKVLTGFNGERDLITIANEIATLAEAIVDDMASMARRQRRVKRPAN